MPSSQDAHFPPTSWTVIARVRSEDPAVVSEAIATIYGRYRYPLYCWLRRKELTHSDAEDVLHDFFARFIRRRSLEQADADKGRLRGYLVISLERHFFDWLDHRSRRPMSSGQSDELIHRYESEPSLPDESPALAYERAWAISVIHASLGRLAARYERRGKSKLFESLRAVILEGGSLRGHDSTAIAASLSMTEEALRATLHRMLGEFGRHLREEVGETVESPEEIEPEIHHLLRLFSA